LRRSYRFAANSPKQFASSKSVRKHKKARTLFCEKIGSLPGDEKNSDDLKHLPPIAATPAGKQPFSFFLFKKKLFPQFPTAQ
jgi:hypothetical protein